MKTTKTLLLTAATLLAAAFLLSFIPGAEAAPTTVTVHQGGNTYNLGAMANGADIATFYDYGGLYPASSSMGFETPDESRIFVWGQPGGGSAIVINHNIATGAPGPDGKAGTVGLAWDGMSGGAWTVLDDDPANFALDSYSDTATYNAWSTCCTDGGAYTGLGDSFCITVTPTEWGSLNGLTVDTTTSAIDTWSFLSGNPAAPVRTDLDMDQPITIEGNHGCAKGKEGQAVSVYGVVPAAGGELVAAADTGVIRSTEALYEERYLAQAEHDFGTVTGGHSIVDIGSHTVKKAGIYPVPSEGGEQVYAGSETEEVILNLGGSIVEIRGAYADAYASCSEQAGITRVREILIDGVRLFLPVNAGQVTGHNTDIQLGQYNIKLNWESKTAYGFESAGAWITAGDGTDIRIAYAHAQMYGCEGEDLPDEQGPRTPHWFDPIAPFYADGRLGL